MKNIYLNTNLVIFIIITIYGCNNDNKVGIYTTQNTINIVDTLILKENNQYERILRRKFDKSLIFKNTGTWYFSKKNSRIELSDYYVSDDQKYILRKSNTYFEDVLMNVSAPFYTENGKMIIIIGDYSNLRYLKE